ncbi:hypothetical protein [Kiloniella spongiae]|uniref:hypothetical protein n=1 Tax=Kiloniella spongiae TaxID=1489064 RepID=UPI00069ABD8A|nr:hypothetical protein [Kiloniella spongiae]
MEQRITLDAVKKAIDECDNLGETTFLKNYGFGRSTRYLLEYDKNDYASKAIYGVAYGHVNLKKGKPTPLKWNEFKGGKKLVVPELERLNLKIKKIYPPGS